MKRLQFLLAGDGGEQQIDLTPMLDVVFIMLIFFIVTTSFVKEAGVEVKRPQAATATREPAASILVAIRPNGEIWIDRRAVDVRAVRANIERLRVDTPNAPVIIQADTDARTGLLVQVMDQIRMAGVNDISLSAESPAS